jgi:hypothetical protein
MGRWAYRLYERLSDGRIEWLMRLADKKGLPAQLSASTGIGFDWHGGAMLHILKQVVRPFSRRLRSNPPDNNPLEARSHV